MTTAELERFLHDNIPLTGAIGARVEEVTEAGARLTAPLGPNANHHGSGFGGSIASLALLAGWAVVQVAAGRAGLGGPDELDVVVQETRITFLAPALARLDAWAAAPDEDAWATFLRTFERRGRARLEVEVVVRSGDAEVARLHGRFVAVRAAPAGETSLDAKGLP